MREKNSFRAQKNSFDCHEFAQIFCQVDFYYEFEKTYRQFLEYTRKNSYAYTELEKTYDELLNMVDDTISSNRWKHSFLKGWSLISLCRQFNHGGNNQKKIVETIIQILKENTEFFDETDSLEERYLVIKICVDVIMTCCKPKWRIVFCAAIWDILKRVSEDERCDFYSEDTPNIVVQRLLNISNLQKDELNCYDSFFDKKYVQDFVKTLKVNQHKTIGEKSRKRKREYHSNNIEIFIWFMIAFIIICLAFLFIILFGHIF